MMNISDVKPYDKNPRKNDDSVKAVANSIREFGFKNPVIVDKNMVVIAGHTRLKAAELLQLSEIPVIVADDLTQEQADMLRIADNKTGELSSWDIPILGDELKKLDGAFDFTNFGFSQKEVDQLLDKAESQNDGFAGLGDAETRVHPGDIWLLGDHRLMCGDSTKTEAVATLMGGG